MKYLSLLLLFCSVSVFGQDYFNTETIKTHISYLASDKLKGRAPGSKGEKLAQKYIIKEFQSLGIEPKGSKGYLQEFTYKTPKNPHEADLGGAEENKGSNVIGFLNNGMPNTIIIGAHYDHLGTDGRGSSLDPNPKGKIHNGADDNASGVAGVIEFARYYSQNGITEKYNFLFICFSAEEAGLIGSKYFTNNTILDFEKVDFMLNMDMVGRLDEDRHLMVYGVGTSPSFAPLLAKDNGGFRIVIDSSGVGPSDHTSFYLKNLPVLHFFTGSHSDYHKPSDDVDKINLQGERDVLKYISSLIDQLASEPKLVFTPVATKEREAVAFKVTLGVLPDYSYTDKGMRIDGVTAGKPASKAGLEGGDIIIKMGDLDIKDIYDYMDGLAKHKKGDTTSLQYLRKGELKETKVEF